MNFSNVSNACFNILTKFYSFRICPWSSVICMEEQEASLWGTTSLQNKQCKWLHWHCHGTAAALQKKCNCLDCHKDTPLKFVRDTFQTLWPLLQSKDSYMDLREFNNVIRKTSLCIVVPPLGNTSGYYILKYLSLIALSLEKSLPWICYVTCVLFSSLPRPFTGSCLLFVTSCCFLCPSSYCFPA